ncbi:MAG: 4-carboxymuconolactone decarboxylase [Alphaproteobacteria bacterium]|nr:4-carboxymuconolactone decarboxylase [Alphaproteobacteria bacterium]
MDERDYERGLAKREAVLGDAYVEKALASADDFSRPLQDLVTSFAWGQVWTREELPPRTRSLVNLAMLAALNRPHELRIHLRGAVNNGCTNDEIREVLLQTAVYCGFPAAIDAFRAAREVLVELGRLPPPKG